MQSIAHKRHFQPFVSSQNGFFAQNLNKYPVSTPVINLKGFHMDRILRWIKFTSAVVLVTLLSVADLQAQTRTISGVVRTDKETLPGVTVVEKGTSNGTVTDIEGRYSLPVPDGATLV